MTTNLIDLQNSDVIMVTSNMAENHPVGFQWVMKAKERGATIIHVDLRFTRTSAAADMHVPLRSGTNIVFFGGLIKYAIDHNLYFKDYVVHYTNASFLIDPEFKTATDRGGLFTGFDPEKRAYDQKSWKNQLDAAGNPNADLTLRDPNPNGVENIRPLCILHLLLGNIGRPGGGVVALRGHANVQGATDLAVLYQDLPGYMAMPFRDRHPTFKDYLETETPKSGFWVNKPKFFVSLLKAGYGDAGTKDNDFGYDWLPKRASADAH